MEKSWLKSYDSGIPGQIEIPEKDLYQFFRQAAESSPDKTAVIYYSRKLSFRHLYNLVLRFTAGLQSLNVRKGDRIVIALPNIPQFLICYWAALRIGAINVLINPILSERELSYQIKNSGANIVLIYDKMLPRIRKINNELDLNHVIIAGAETYMPFFLNFALQIKNKFQLEKNKIQSGINTVLFRELLDRGTCDAVKVDIRPHDPAVMIYTGGVTGTPKGALLSHKNLVANTIQAKAWITDFKDGQEVILSVLPLIHSYGMTACHHLAIQSCSTMILHPRFRINRILNDIQKYKVTIFPGVPTMYTALVNQALKEKINLYSVRVCISGAAPLPLKLKREFEKVTQGRLVEGYGLTEASPITHCNPIFGVNKESSIGLPWPNTEARVVGLETNRPMGPGKIGEIEIRGPQVMLGYWEMDHETKDVFTPDGWLKTGDIGKYDKDGYFYITDRKKDIIFYGGENIYPGEVEHVLTEHPCVSEAAVMGIADEYYGQTVKAYIVLKENKQATSEEILDFCQDRLAKYKIPRSIEFVEFLPKNFLGKVVKRKLVASLT
ncbi:long-chain fatty acid--CoA ligase [candidate division KSB1 bacterium]|nr:long-chain fatty acid--CoA ligase [candidate division KSB1 bacterium]